MKKPYSLSEGSAYLFCVQAMQIPMLTQLIHTGVVSWDATLEFHLALSKEAPPCHMADLDIELGMTPASTVSSVCGLGDAIIYGYLNVSNTASTGIITEILHLNNNKYAQGLQEFL